MGAWKIFEILAILFLPIGVVGLVVIHLIENDLSKKKDVVRWNMFQSYHPVCPKCRSKKLKLKRLEVRDGVYYESVKTWVSKKGYYNDELGMVDVQADVMTISDDVTCMNCGTTVSHTITPPDRSIYTLVHKYATAQANVIYEGDYDLNFVDHVVKSELISNAVINSKEYKSLDDQGTVAQKFKTFFILALVFCVMGILLYSCTR